MENFDCISAGALVEVSTSLVAPCRVGKGAKCRAHVPPGGPSAWASLPLSPPYAAVVAERDRLRCLMLLKYRG